MTPTPTIPPIPQEARAIIYNPPTHTLTYHPSHPVPIPSPSKSDHFIAVRTTALCARELTWPLLFPEAIYTETPSKPIIPAYDIAGTVLTLSPRLPLSRRRRNLRPHAAQPSGKLS